MPSGGGAGSAALDGPAGQMGLISGRFAMIAVLFRRPLPGKGHEKFRPECNKTLGSASAIHTLMGFRAASAQRVT